MLVTMKSTSAMSKNFTNHKHYLTA